MFTVHSNMAVIINNCLDFIRKSHWFTKMMQRIRSSGIYFLRSQSREIRFTTPETVNTIRHSYSRDFGIFSSIRDKVSNKLEERNQAKAGISSLFLDESFITMINFGDL